MSALPIPLQMSPSSRRRMSARWMACRWACKGITVSRLLRLGCAAVSSFAAVAAFICIFSSAGTLEAAPPVRGEIREDTVWQGNVHISADVTISNAELRLLPGTTVFFDKPNTMGEGPVVLLNAPVSVYKNQESRGARLTMIGTAEQPIVIETREGKPRGSILCGRGIIATVTARHVIFRRMGRVIGRGVVDPAVEIRMDGSTDDTWLSDCRFEDCGPVSVECQSNQATLEIRGCRFERSAGDTAVSVGGFGPGTKVIAENVLDAGIRITCPQILVHNNILVGPMAGIDIASPDLVGLRILDNWVSLESQPLWGRSALSCASTAATLAGNVLQGGSRVLDAAATRISGNTIIGVRFADGDQTTERGQPSTRNMPASLLNLSDERSEVTDNYFLGPCHEGISLGRSVRGIAVRHNLFDGLNLATCALAFHEVPSGPAGIDLSWNVFVRYKNAPVVNPSRQPGALAEAADNLFAMTPQPAYQGVDNLAELSARERYVDRPEINPEDLDSGWKQHHELQGLLLQGKISLTEARARLCAGYSRVCSQLNAGSAAKEKAGPQPFEMGVTSQPVATSPSEP